MEQSGNGAGTGTAVRDLQPGRPMSGLFVLSQARLGNARNGPFWTLGLRDATGEVTARIWSPQAQEYSDLKSGMIVEAAGQVEEYRGRTQVRIDNLRPVDPEAEQVDLAALVPSSPEKPEDMLARLEELCRINLRYPPWRRFATKVLADKEIRARLLAATGAKSIHHAYVGGLLEHTLSVTGLVLKFCDHYPELDREILTAAAVFHDLGKAWELDAVPAPEYTDQGRLLGHIHIGLEILAPFLEKSGLPQDLKVHFKHIMLSHHGEYEFGSPRRPKTGEAFALHFADNLDARINQFGGVFDPEAEPGTWSDYQPTLSRFLYRPERTPGQEQEDRSSKSKENQCSLPLKA